MLTEGIYVVYKLGEEPVHHMPLMGKLPTEFIHFGSYETGTAQAMIRTAEEMGIPAMVVAKEGRRYPWGKVSKNSAYIHIGPINADRLDQLRSRANELLATTLSA